MDSTSPWDNSWEVETPIQLSEEDQELPLEQLVEKFKKSILNTIDILQNDDEGSEQRYGFTELMLLYLDNRLFKYILELNGIPRQHQEEWIDTDEMWELLKINTK